MANLEMITNGRGVGYVLHGLAVTVINLTPERAKIKLVMDSSLFGMPEREAAIEGGRAYTFEELSAGRRYFFQVDGVGIALSFTIPRPLRTFVDGW